MRVMRKTAVRHQLAAGGTIALVEVTCLRGEADFHRGVRAEKMLAHVQAWRPAHCGLREPCCKSDFVADFRHEPKCELTLVLIMKR